MKTLNANGSFTVFAPTNTAFAKLKKAAPDTFAAVASDKALLQKVLTYHVLAKKVGSTAAVAAAKKKASVKTVQGERIRLSLEGGKLYLNGNSRVIVADVMASQRCDSRDQRGSRPAEHHVDPMSGTEHDHPTRAARGSDRGHGCARSRSCRYGEQLVEHDRRPPVR